MSLINSIKPELNLKLIVNIICLLLCYYFLSEIEVLVLAPFLIKNSQIYLQPSLITIG